MGTGTSGQRDRPLDMIEGRVAGPPGALAGDTRGSDSGAAQPNPDAHDAWKRAAEQAAQHQGGRTINP